MFDFLILWVYCVFEKIFKWFHVFLNKLATFQLVLVSSEFLGMLPEVFFFFFKLFQILPEEFFIPDSSMADGMGICFGAQEFGMDC